MDWDQLYTYKVDKNLPLPSGEPIDKLVEEEDKL